jgi:glycosyltransferase involved in cell wall biosynthesis
LRLAAADTEQTAAPEAIVRDAGVKRRPIALLVKRFPKLSETFILHEVLALEAAGWPITIFTLEPPSDAISHADVATVKAEIVPLDPKRAVADLAQQCGQRNIAHIHAHFADNPSAIARVAAKKAGIGYSISAHAKDIYLADPAQLRRNMAAARFVTTCTSHNAEHLRRIAPGVPVAKLYHGIDCDKFAQLKHEPQSPPIILSVGRLRTKKGFDTLIDACAAMRAKGSDFSCRIIGYGPEELTLSQQISRLGLDAQVKLIGKQAHDVVLDQLRQASVFALPCRIDADGDRDGIPNVLLEAMAAGVPIVTTAVSGIPEVLTDGFNGRIVPPDNPEALADAIAATLENHERTAALTHNARETVHSRFGCGQHIAALDRMLLTATGEGGSIGYFIKGFPRLSESFISNEVLKLERMGKLVTIFAGQRGDALAASVLTELNTPLAYLPPAGSVSKNSLWRWLRIAVPAYLPAHLRLMRRRPTAWMDGLRKAMTFARAYRHDDGRRFKRSYMKQFAQAGAVAEALERAGVTHLHGHFCHSATTISWLAADMAGVPFSFTAHAKDIYEARHNPGDLLARKVEAASFVTTCTAANHDHMAEALHNPDNLHTVYHGLDTTFFRAETRVSNGPVRILAVGRHVEKKGFDLLLRALAQLQFAGMDFRCRLIGESGGTTTELQALRDDLGLDQTVSIDPPEPREQLRQSYYDADIFVLPCRIDDSGDRDGIPNVLAEAMATGLAVLSTNISGIPEIVIDGENGLLVEPENVEALAAALGRLCTDELLRARLGTNAAKRIEQVFDADQTIYDLKTLFEKGHLLEAAE